MLVLSRKEQEAILIGENVEIQVVDIGGGRVRLGITAPSDVPVDRREVRERMAGKTAAQDAARVAVA